MVNVCHHVFHFPPRLRPMIQRPAPVLPISPELRALMDTAGWVRPGGRVHWQKPRRDVRAGWRAEREVTGYDKTKLYLLPGEPSARNLVGKENSVTIELLYFAARFLKFVHEVSF